MSTFFSATTLWFYNFADKEKYEAGIGWPADAVEVSPETVATYTLSPPAGKQLGSDASGSPAWVDIPPLPTDILYEQELNEINSDYDKDISVLALKYSRAGLFDGSTEESKKTELFAALQARKEKYSTDLDALDIKYGA